MKKPMILTLNMVEKAREAGWVMHGPYLYSPVKDEHRFVLPGGTARYFAKPETGERLTHAAMRKLLEKKPDAEA